MLMMAALGRGKYQSRLCWNEFSFLPIIRIIQNLPGLFQSLSFCLEIDSNSRYLAHSLMVILRLLMFSLCTRVYLAVLMILLDLYIISLYPRPKT